MSSVIRGSGIDEPWVWDPLGEANGDYCHTHMVLPYGMVEYPLLWSDVVCSRIPAVLVQAM